jgi:hypothetical protein
MVLLKGVILFTRTTTLQSSAFQVYVSSNFARDLQGGTSGATGLNNVLAEANSGGQLAMGGTLNLATVIVPSVNNFKAIQGFTLGHVGLVETAKGVALYGAK